MINPEDAESGQHCTAASNRADDAADLAGSQPHHWQPGDATVALQAMAESAANANRVLTDAGSYTIDEAVCASAATVAAVCEILGRLTPFLDLACGCRHEAITPPSPVQWVLMFDGSVSLRPSIGNGALPCRSHYVIQAGRVQWARSDSEAENQRESRQRPSTARQDANHRHAGQADTSHSPAS